MDHYQARDLELSPSTIAREFTRADLVFYGVDHRGPSFEALVFLNAPEATPDTPLDVADGFAGSFVIFGHGGCYGDVGHCEVPSAPRDPFDSRPPHGLTPQTKMVEITEAFKHPRCSGETLTVTVLPVVAGADGAKQADVLFFTGLRLLTYR
ncbi:MAG: hypothetical protein ACLPUT_03265 [Solirubrobacteraceae bacterium]